MSQQFQSYQSYGSWRGGRGERLWLSALVARATEVSRVLRYAYSAWISLIVGISADNNAPNCTPDPSPVPRTPTSCPSALLPGASFNTDTTWFSAPVICAAVSPYRATRNDVRSMVGSDRFIEVFVDTPIAVCEQRDVKGMYAKARRGEITGFTGIDDPYEAPLDPELTLNTEAREPEDNAHLILDYLIQNGFVQGEPAYAEPDSCRGTAGSARRHHGTMSALSATAVPASLKTAANAPRKPPAVMSASPGPA